MAKEKILKEVEGKIETLMKKGFDPKEFFKTRKGLYVWADFIERIASKAPILAEESSLLLQSADLVEDASDEEIEKNLSEKHFFSESEVCSVIAELIAKQPKGGKGTLLNNGYWNLFYTSAFVVSVSWYDVYGGWDVDAWRRDVRRWFADRRVFSPATER